MCEAAKWAIVSKNVMFQDDSKPAFQTTGVYLAPVPALSSFLTCLSKTGVSSA